MEFDVTFGDYLYEPVFFGKGVASGNFGFLAAVIGGARLQ